MTSKITIIGSGLSSAVLSKKFNENEIQIFDKSRGPGGRSSTTRVEILEFLIMDFSLLVQKMKNLNYFYLII